MQIIKLDATPSTNVWLKEFWQKNSSTDWVVVWASDQTTGRGQQGTVWESSAGKNLTISILKQFGSFKTEDQFYLNIGVSLAVYETLKYLKLPEICVKWPNDIMSGSGKLCGILIENMVKSRNISASVIGIGLNVNQEEFPGLPRATSMINATGKSFDLDKVLYLLLEKLQFYLNSLETGNFGKLRTSYERVMYRINTPSRFKLADGIIVSGEITGVEVSGRLNVKIGNTNKSFDTKEVELLD